MSIERRAENPYPQVVVEQAGYSDDAVKIVEIRQNDGLKHAVPLTEDDVRERIRVGETRSHFHIASVQGQPAGMMEVKYNGSNAEITEFSVVQSMQRQQVGSSMLERVADFTAMLGDIRTMSMTTSEKAPVNSLLRRAGFEPIEEIVNGRWRAVQKKLKWQLQL